jgi:hypothetical protein
MNNAILNITNRLDSYLIRKHNVCITKYVNDFGTLIYEVKLIGVLSKIKYFVIKKQIKKFMDSRYTICNVIIKF